MRARILTALVLAAVLIGVLLYGSAWSARALFGLFIAGGAWEWSAFLGAAARARRAVYMLLVASLAIAAELLLPGTREFSVLMVFGVCWWTVALLWLLSAPQWTPGWAAALAGVCALAGTLFSALFVPPSIILAIAGPIIAAVYVTSARWFG